MESVRPHIRRGDAVNADSGGLQVLRRMNTHPKSGDEMAREWLRTAIEVVKENYGLETAKYAVDRVRWEVKCEYEKARMTKLRGKECVPLD